MTEYANVMYDAAAKRFTNDQCEHTQATTYSGHKKTGQQRVHTGVK